MTADRTPTLRQEEYVEWTQDPETGRGGWFVRTRYPPFIPLYGLRELACDVAYGRMGFLDWVFVPAVLHVLVR